MRIDVIDAGRGDVRALQSSLHRLSRTAAGGLRLCDVKIVRGNAIANDFRKHRRAPASRQLEIFHRQNRSTFAQHHTRSMLVKRAAFLRRRCLKRIEAYKDHL